ncbi:MAG: ferredoxin reductase, partial [Actinomycetales bacterium]
MTARSVVVVGGSTAGATAMRELRRDGHEGPIVLLDPADGTNRPPLSKAVLARGDDASSVLMDHTSLGVEHVRASAVGLDADGRTVLDDQGRRHPYDALVIAAGSRARTLAAPGQDGELVLRTVEDAVALRARLGTAST